MTAAYDLAVRRALEMAGVEFIDENGGGPGVRLRKAEAEQIFFNDPLLIVEDVSHSIREFRLHTLGRTDVGRLLHVSFTLRADGRLIRVISARAMHRKERIRYEQKA